VRTIRKRHRSFRYGRLSAPASLVETLEEVRALLGASVPTGDVAELVERGLKLLKASALKKRFGAAAAGSKRRRAKKRASGDAKATSGDSGRREGRPKGSSGVSPGTVGGASRQRSRYIPAHVRSEVWARDGGACSYVAADGTRCGSRKHLELHQRRLCRRRQAALPPRASSPSRGLSGGKLDPRFPHGRSRNPRVSTLAVRAQWPG